MNHPFPVIEKKRHSFMETVSKTSSTDSGNNRVERNYCKGRVCYMFCERYIDPKYPVDNSFHLEKPYAFRVIPTKSPLPFTALVNQFPSVIPHKKPI